MLIACDQPNSEGQKQDYSKRKEQGIEASTSRGESDSLSAQANLINTEGKQIGTAKLKQMNDGVQITIDAKNLPAGMHGFHIHEKGICEPPKFETAGAHFNPTNAKHGFDNPKGPHAGDLLNLEVEQDGTVHANVLAKMVTLEKGKKNSLFKADGTSLIIHSDADDYVSQPAGNAGERIACGVIE